MKNNTRIQKIDKKIQKFLKNTIKNQNELFQLFLLAFGFFLVIYISILIYNTLSFLQIMLGFVLVGSLLIVVSHKTGGEKKPQITLFFEKYIGDILYSSFILFVIVSIYNLIFVDSTGLVVLFYGVLAIYIFAKLLDHQIMESIIKTKGRNIDFFQIAIIFGSIVFIVLHYILSQFDIVDPNYITTLSITAIFILLFVFLFSNLSEHSKKAVSKEKIHSHVQGNTYRYLLGFTIIISLGIISWQQFHVLDESLIGNESIFEQKFEEKPVEAIAEPIEEFIQEIEPVQIVTLEARIEELYAFNSGLQLGDSGDDVAKLQEFMVQKNYYFGNLDGNFDEETRIGLRNTLIGECDWPESTRGILGPQAILCINSIVVTYEEEVIPEENTISEEETVAQEDIFNTLEQNFE